MKEDNPVLLFSYRMERLPQSFSLTRLLPTSRHLAQATVVGIVAIFGGDVIAQEKDPQKNEKKVESMPVEKQWENNVLHVNTIIEIRKILWELKQSERKGYGAAVRRASKKMELLLAVYQAQCRNPIPTEILQELFQNRDMKYWYTEYFSKRNNMLHVRFPSFENANALEAWETINKKSNLRLEITPAAAEKLEKALWTLEQSGKQANTLTAIVAKLLTEHGLDLEPIDASGKLINPNEDIPNSFRIITTDSSPRIVNQGDTVMIEGSTYGYLSIPIEILRKTKK